MNLQGIKNLLMPLFLMGCFPMDFQEGKRPIKVGKRPIKEGKRPINANGQFSGALPLWGTAPLKRPIKRSMRGNQSIYLHRNGHLLENGLDRPKNRIAMVDII